jgi:hypothetical protein
MKWIICILFGHQTKSRKIERGGDCGELWGEPDGLEVWCDRCGKWWIY